MPDTPIPDDVKQFLLKNIDSIIQWEGLLLLRAKSGQECSVEYIAQNLYTNTEELVDAMAQLAMTDIISGRKTESTLLYSYRPQDPELDQMISRTADLYRHYLIAITHIIHSKSKNRVQKFADAFRLRKD